MLKVVFTAGEVLLGVRGAEVVCLVLISKAPKDLAKRGLVEMTFEPQTYPRTIDSC